MTDRLPAESIWVICAPPADWLAGGWLTGGWPADDWLVEDWLAEEWLAEPATASRALILLDGTVGVLSPGY